MDTADEAAENVADQMAIDLLSTPDAEVWARQFFTVWPDAVLAREGQELNREDAHDVMRGWFANAISAGEMAELSRQGREEDPSGVGDRTPEQG